MSEQPAASINCGFTSERPADRPADQRPALRRPRACCKSRAPSRTARPTAAVADAAGLAAPIAHDLLGNADPRRRRGQRRGGRRLRRRLHRLRSPGHEHPRCGRARRQRDRAGLRRGAAHVRRVARGRRQRAATPRSARHAAAYRRASENGASWAPCGPGRRTTSRSRSACSTNRCASPPARPRGAQARPVPAASTWATRLACCVWRLPRSTPPPTCPICTA